MATRPWDVEWLKTHGFSLEENGEKWVLDNGGLKIEVLPGGKGFSAKLSLEGFWGMEEDLPWKTPEEAVRSILGKMDSLKEEAKLQGARIPKIDFI